MESESLNRSHSVLRKWHDDFVAQNNRLPVTVEVWDAAWEASRRGYYTGTPQEAARKCAGNE